MCVCGLSFAATLIPLLLFFPSLTPAHQQQASKEREKGKKRAWIDEHCELQTYLLRASRKKSGPPLWCDVECSDSKTSKGCGRKKQNTSKNPSRRCDIVKLLGLLWLFLLGNLQLGTVNKCSNFLSQICEEFLQGRVVSSRCRSPLLPPFPLLLHWCLISVAPSLPLGKDCYIL